MVDVEDHLRREAARGQLAQDLLDHELFREAFGSVESAIIQKWKDCPVRDKEVQHELKIMLKLLTEVRRHVETVAETGTLATTQLIEEGKLKKMARKMGL